ncbi:MAG: metal ABC transporter permease [Clostridia bacterium]|nr:metal ABC transporter permease [Clostridia bacterium]MDR3643918.1 metal ABC transporter permease [Clostridia bacterium]
MNLWYQMLSVLPFDWAQPGHMIFMKNALLAVIIITPLFGLIGTMIVQNRMAFFSDALGHGAFTGIVIGVMSGFFSPLWAAIAFSLAFSFAVTLVKHRAHMNSDTVIGVFTSMSIAAGIFLSTLNGNSFNKMNAYLIGDILSITTGQIAAAAIVLAVTVVLWVFLLNPLFLSSISTSLAQSRGVNVLLIECVFSALVAVIVTISMSWVGLLVINSFLVLPAASARNITRNIRSYHLTAVLFSLFAGIAGLLTSYYTGTASGATIILFSSAIFMVTFLMRKRAA